MVLHIRLNLFHRYFLMVLIPAVQNIPAVHPLRPGKRKGVQVIVQNVRIRPLHPSLLPHISLFRHRPSVLPGADHIILQNLFSILIRLLHQLGLFPGIALPYKQFQHRSRIAAVHRQTFIGVVLRISGRGQFNGVKQCHPGPGHIRIGVIIRIPGPGHIAVPGKMTVLPDNFYLLPCLLQRLQPLQSSLRIGISQINPIGIGVLQLRVSSDFRQTSIHPLPNPEGHLSRFFQFLYLKLNRHILHVDLGHICLDL